MQVLSQKLSNPEEEMEAFIKQIDADPKAPVEFKRLVREVYKPFYLYIHTAYNESQASATRERSSQEVVPQIESILANMIVQVATLTSADDVYSCVTSGQVLVNNIALRLNDIFGQMAQHYAIHGTLDMGDGSGKPN